MGIRVDATTIYVEDSAHADAGGDGFYSMADLYAFAGLAEVQIFKRTLIGQDYYHSLLNIQWGDTGGNYTGLDTNWKFDTRVMISFASGRGFRTRTTNQNLLNVYGGEKVSVGDGSQAALGKWNWVVESAQGGSLTANWYLYDGLWSAATTTNFFNAQDDVSEICGMTFDNTATSGLFNFQPSGTNKFKLWYRNRLHGSPLGSTVLNSIPPATILDNPTIILGGGSAGIQITPAARDLARPIVVGIPTSSDFSISGTADGNWIIEPQFSGNATRYVCASGATPTSSSPVYEAWEVLARIYDPLTGVARAGISIELIDKLGASWIDVDTDANGEAVFGSALRGNRVPMARIYTSGSAGPAVVDSLAPFSLKVNHKHTDATLAVLDHVLIPSGDATQDWRGMILEIGLGAPTSIPPPLVTVDVPYFQQDEVPVFLRDFGQDVSVGGSTTKGIVDKETVERLEGWTTHVSPTDIVITIQTDSLPAAAPSVPLNTDATDYLIREVRLIDDGALTQLLVALT